MLQQINAFEASQFSQQCGASICPVDVVDGRWGKIRSKVVVEVIARDA